MSEKTKFEVIQKNGKPFVRMTSGAYVTDMKVWKVKTDAPYVRYLGHFFYLDEDMKRQLA